MTSKLFEHLEFTIPKTKKLLKPRSAMAWVFEKNDFLITLSVKSNIVSLQQKVAAII